MRICARFAVLAFLCLAQDPVFSQTAGSAAPVLSPAAVLSGAAARQPDVSSCAASIAVSTAPAGGECGLFFNRCVLATTMSAADSVQEMLSRRFTCAADNLDQLLSLSKSTAAQNTSALFASAVYTRTDSGASVSPEINLRLRLPRTQGRLNIMVEHVSDNVLSRAGQQITPINQTQERLALGQNNAGSFIGMNYVMGVERALQDNIDTGLHVTSRGSAPYLVALPFARWSFSWHKRLGSWENRLYSQAMWDSVPFLDVTGGWHLSRSIGGDWSVVSSANFDWKTNAPNVTLYETLSFPWKATPKDTITPAAGMSADTWPAAVPTAYTIYAGWRRRLWKNWIFGEITPSANYYRTAGYRLEKAASARLDFIFGAESAGQLPAK